MKLLVVLCLKEYQHAVTLMLKQAHAGVFTVIDATGFKSQGPANLLDNWFSSSEEAFNSVVLFTFTTTETAVETVALVKQYNNKNPTGYPVRAFVMSVDLSSNEQ